MSKTLHVEIDPKSDKEMKEAGYKLCLAKFSSSGDPNVLWSGTEYVS